MTIHEFGKENQRVMVLIHPSLVMWDYFEYVIPLLMDRYGNLHPQLIWGRTTTIGRGGACCNFLLQYRDKT